MFSGVKTQFIIRKTHTAYLVTVIGQEVIIEPLETLRSNTTCKAISDTLQTIGNTKLVLVRPEDPVHYLKGYYESKGWEIEGVPNAW